MSKQISVKALKTSGASIKQLYEEAQKYLLNIGFAKEPIFSVTEASRVTRVNLYAQGKEKVLMEYHQDLVEEILKLTFKPSDIKFVHDILLMRFNQVAREKQGNVLVFNS
jgi:hypothetical protein